MRCQNLKVLKFLIITLILALNLISNLYPQLINTSYIEWYDISLYKYTNQVSIITDFYKFIITPLPHQTINVRPGETEFLFQNIYNVGSLDETVGIDLIKGPLTNSGVIIGTYSSQNTNSPINNTGPLNSGYTFGYYIGVTIATDYTGGDFYVIITNRGSPTTHPAYFIVMTNRVHVIKQRVEIVKASDGIHSLNYDQFNGNYPLGNLDIKIYVAITGEKPISVVLFYDMNGVPDGTAPDGTINKNRKIELIWNPASGYWEGKIPVTDPEIADGNNVNIILGVKSSGETDYALFDRDGKVGNEGVNNPWQFRIREYKEVADSAASISEINKKFDPSFQKYYLIYKLSRRSHVNVSVFNVRGELVRQLKNEVEDIGKYVVEWDGKNDRGEYVAMGLYLVILQSSEFGEVRKVIVIKR